MFLFLNLSVSWIYINSHNLWEQSQYIHKIMLQYYEDEISKLMSYSFILNL